ncbi:hypothetical protein ACF090_34430 [Streptomyces sp. NPDC014892]|uniref:oxidoreductase n=1 Tax=Streptomyces sp. NPDC014892 TaxID=3364930 RepID=UPI0037006D2C
MTTAFDLSGKALANRMAMAPRTRSRADAPPTTATERIATHYTHQRASAGPITTEAIQPSVRSQGTPTPLGLHTAQ